MKSKWNNNKTIFKGYEIERSKLNSGRYLYYVMGHKYPDYAAPHHYMSDKHRTLQSAKSEVLRHLSVYEHEDMVYGLEAFRIKRKQRKTIKLVSINQPSIKTSPRGVLKAV